MASQGKAASNPIPAITSSQSGASLPPIPPMLQKNTDNSQKKSTAVFQSKSSGISSSSTINNDVSVLVSQMKSYMEQQERTNQKILREIEEIEETCGGPISIGAKSVRRCFSGFNCPTV